MSPLRTYDDLKPGVVLVTHGFKEHKEALSNPNTSALVIPNVCFLLQDDYHPFDSSMFTHYLASFPHESTLCLIFFLL